MYQVPVVYLDKKIVGSISLTQEMEVLLADGMTFVLSASVVEDKFKTRKTVVGVTLTIEPMKEKDNE